MCSYCNGNSPIKTLQVDVIELLDPRDDSMAQYQKSLSNDSSYESANPDYYSPNRMVYLDGQIQSSLKGEQAYHEGQTFKVLSCVPRKFTNNIVPAAQHSCIQQ